ncbi:OTU domain-containing protein 3 [Alosa sapidissima]|uniref:OTU domain-containing protein 3 n=1 Tax=Alosa sapidissima TaxID=34773 RepID=UPI001C08C2B0|nr:OTU domain-containing protein 3 [Alosa sapidissima]XP_041953347.1 OTU domain-containing protein 3 [Alosa sapidissima]XP_041953348.1 OTU domain-containing protein 3 [Alosa sapidissima]
MSRKQSAKPVRGNRKYDLERKRDERAARRALAKDRKNRPPGADEGEEFVSFSNQLQALGLKLREVPGDGNCLFRALGDQLEGHSRGHLRLRQETVQYMMDHRQDFEPFVEDEVPFTQHLSNLSQPGMFAGNDAIVSFARSQQVKVVIHQLNAPLWEINGSEKQLCRELHIAYRYGDHYDSVRHIGDNSESPSHLRIENLNKTRRQREFGDGLGELHTGPPASPSPSEDEDVILSSLRSASANGQGENLCHSSATTQPRHAEWLEPELRNQGCPAHCESGSEAQGSECRCMATESSEKKGSPDGSTVQKAKVSNKQRKEQQRLDKKRRQEERHRQKVQQGKGSHDQNQNLPEQVTLVPALNTLSI